MALRRSVAATGDHPHHPGQDYPSRGGFAGSTRDGGTFGISVSMAGASAVLFFWREANIFSARCSHRSASPSNFQRLSGSHAACCRQSKAVARYASALLSPRSMKVLPACNVRSTRVRGKRSRSRRVPRAGPTPITSRFLLVAFSSREPAPAGIRSAGVHRPTTFHDASRSRCSLKRW